jgi:DNA-directed RNA polymerase specialized sigma24 family protein
MSSELNLPTDEELITEYYACDPNAFKTLWMGQAKPLRIGYRSRLVKYLARQFSNIKEHDRENIVDEIGLKVADSKRTGKYDTGTLFRPWVFTLKKNQALSFLLRRGNQILTGQENEDGTPLDTLDRPASQTRPC